MFTIKLNAIKLPFKGGYYEEERRVSQFIEVDVELMVESHEFLKAEELEHTVDYSKVPPIVKDVVGSGVKLLESMAVEISNRIKESYDLVTHVEVTIRKWPQLECANSGVTVSYNSEVNG